MGGHLKDKDKNSSNFSKIRKEGTLSNKSNVKFTRLNE